MSSLTEIIYRNYEKSVLPEDNNIIMSEKVQSMANGIYREFERLIESYDSAVVKNLMPLIVTVLENLNELDKSKLNNDMEIELLREDNFALMNQYDKEKSTRRSLEEKIMDLEYTFEDEKKIFNEKIENLEANVRLVELKSRNANDNLLRLEEKEKEQKKEYQKLYERYTDIFKCHADLLERLKLSGNCNVISLQKHSLNKFLKPIDIGSETIEVNADPSYKRYAQTDNYDLELLEQTLSNEWKDSGKPEYVTDLIKDSQGKDIDSDIIIDRSQDVDGTAFDELTSEDMKSPKSPRIYFMKDFDNESDIDNDSEFGVGKEIENMIKENQELVETKNALNIVKDDLIKKVDYLTSENDMMRSALDAIGNREIDLKVRISNMEQEMKELRHQNEDFKSKLENVEEPNDSKRFTRVEMAILLKERNQFKEKLLELQDALRYTETVRASRQHPDLLLEPRIKTQSGIMEFFRGLLKPDDESGVFVDEKKKENQCLEISRSDRKVHHKSQKCFIFKEDINRSQLYGWSVPRDLIQSSVLGHIPIPVGSHSILEPKDSILCVTKSPHMENSEQFLWIIVERPVRDGYGFYLAQFSLTSRHEITPNTISYLKISKRPLNILAVPKVSQVINDRGMLTEDSVLSPTESPSKRPSSTISDNVKVSRVHNTRAKVKQNITDITYQTLWINYDDGIIIIYSVTVNNIYDGRLATIFLPGSVSIMKYCQGRVIIAQTDGCLCVFDLKPCLDSWEVQQCLVVEMSHSSPISALVGHRNSQSIWFGSDQQCYVIGVSRLKLMNSFNVNGYPGDDHLCRIESICPSHDSELMWISMSQIGTLYAYDSYTYEMKLSFDFRANLFDIIESIDRCSKFRFSFPIITEDKDRLWLGSDCGFIVCFSKNHLFENKDQTNESPVNIYVSCHGFSGSLVSIVSLPIVSANASSLASTPNSSKSLSPSSKVKSLSKEPVQITDSMVTTKPSSPGPLIVALGSSYVNLNSSPSKASPEDDINRNNVLIWKI